MSEVTAPAASRLRPPGRRAIRTGVALITVSALVIVLGIAAVLLFSKRAGNAELFEMPGGISKELTQGNWAVYTEVVGGSQLVVLDDYGVRPDAE